MLRPKNILLAQLALAIALAISACGSSSEESEGLASAASPDAAATSADDSGDPTTEGAAAEEEVVEPAPTEEATEPASDGASSVRVELADGRSWEMDGSCAFNPEASGPAAIILDMAGVADDGAELNVLEVWPLDGSTDRGTSFIASFTDDADVLYVLEQVEASGSGDGVSFETGLHENLFYAIGDAPATTGTFSCNF